MKLVGLFGVAESAYGADYAIMLNFFGYIPLRQGMELVWKRTFESWVQGQGGRSERLD